jgi:preprotein translocase subunit SecA
MSAASIADLRPGASLGAYPEREPRDGSRASTAWFAGTTPKRLRRRALQRFVDSVNAAGRSIAEIDLAALQAMLPAARLRLLREGLTESAAAGIFAIVREIAELTLGKHPYDVQLMGAWVMLNGQLAEMQTGEGKSLTAALTACVAAIAGIPVHVITVNDYLVERDAALFQPFYAACGLSVGGITEATAAQARQQIYRRHVVYCCNKHIVFDYLKDRIAMPNRSAGSLAMQSLLHGDSAGDRLLMRGLCFAIVDEADSVLIDDARTPLILSSAGMGSRPDAPFHEALAIAAALVDGEHYIADAARRRVMLTAAGRGQLAPHANRFPAPWAGRLQTEYLITQALCALHLYHRDRDYMVVREKVVIIDLNTGRAMADRKWEHGLHQLIEAREGVAISPPNETLAKLSFQRFFPRYLRLAGMSGTVREVRRELAATYGLGVVAIPTRRASRRQLRPVQVFVDDASRWQAVLEDIRATNTQGRPLLIGTTTVERSEQLGEQLAALGLPHQLLNARLPHFEAKIVEAAGKAGRITVATNMAGRGTDIPLGPGVAARGGLHVISVEPNSAARIDRQLAGRAARQGDPGSYHAYAALSDALIAGAWPASLLRTICRLADADGRLPTWLGRLLVRHGQRRVERRHEFERRQLRRMDEVAANLLAFSGRAE